MACPSPSSVINTFTLIPADIRVGRPATPMAEPLLSLSMPPTAFATLDQLVTEPAKALTLPPDVRRELALKAIAMARVIARPAETSEEEPWPPPGCIR